MSQSERFSYQVVATGFGASAGEVLRVRIGTEPLLIGSGDKVDLQLEDAQILPAHARVVVTSKGQALLINMGEAGTMRLSDEPMPSYTPMNWKPGLIAHLGDYQLEVIALNVGSNHPQVERVHPALLTQENPPVPQSSAGFVIDWGDNKPAEDPIEDVPVGKGTMLYTEEEIFAEENDDTQRRAYPPMPKPPIVVPKPPQAPQSVPVPQTPTPIPEMARTPAMPFSYEGRALGGISGAVKGVVVSGTLPKDWQQAGHLSAQATINPVNLAVGERVRIPISVRNEHDSAVHLRVYTAGLPREAVILSQQNLLIAPGEVTSFDVVLHPKTPPSENQVDLLVRLSDPSLPDVFLTLTLNLNFKDAPNLAGWLDPQTVNDSRSPYVYLQNHTQGSATVFLAGHCDAAGVHILPQQTQVEVPSGQVVQVPIRIDVRERPFLRSARYDYSISALQGTRAPLDYPGMVRIRPQIPGSAIFLVVLLLLAVAIGAYVALSNPRVEGSTSTPPTTQTAVHTETRDAEILAPVDGTQEVTEAVTGEGTKPVRETSPTTVRRTPTRSATATSVPSATPTAEPTDTAVPPSLTPSPTVVEIKPTDAVIVPNVAGCDVAVPDGWQPYTVQGGDRVFRLATDRGTTVDEVARVNCLSDPRVLQVGQVLLLPSP